MTEYVTLKFGRESENCETTKKWEIYVNIPRQDCLDMFRFILSHCDFSRVPGALCNPLTQCILECSREKSEQSKEKLHHSRLLQSVVLWLALSGFSFIPFLGFGLLAGTKAKKKDDLFLWAAPITTRAHRKPLSQYLFDLRGYIEFFQNLAKVILEFMAERFGSKITPVAAEGWTKVLHAVNSIIGEGLEKAKKGQIE